MLRCCYAYLDRTVVTNGHIFGGSKQQCLCFPDLKTRGLGSWALGLYTHLDLSTSHSCEEDSGIFFLWRHHVCLCPHTVPAPLLRAL